MENDPKARARTAAAIYAASKITDGTILGLGTGSTATAFLQALGERVRQGLKIKGVPTSEATATLARELGIELTTLEEHPELDLAVDGADAVDPELQLIKGLGGALLREKLVESAARAFLCIVDESKLYDSLANATAIPVEIVRFGWSRTRHLLLQHGATEAVLRKKKQGGDEPFVTDGGNYILDCRFAKIASVTELAATVKSLVGVVEHGFFVGMATEVVIGAADGTVRVLHRATRA